MRVGVGVGLVELKEVGVGEAFGKEVDVKVLVGVLDGEFEGLDVGFGVQVVVGVLVSVREKVGVVVNERVAVAWGVAVFDGVGGKVFV